MASAKTEGRVNAETKLQAEGTAEWRPLAEVPEFAVASPGTAPPVLPGFLHTCCEQCSGPIEFPEHGLETEVPCPHCETLIRLRDGLSPRATAALFQPTDTVPTREVSPETRVKVGGHVLARKPENKEYSVVTLYLASGAGYLLLMLLFYWSGIIHPIRDLLPIVALGACCALIVVAFHLYERREQERTEALANLAVRLGMEFAAEAPEGFLSVFNELNLFTLGQGVETRNVVQGEVDGVTVSLFDYTYGTGSGKRSHYHRQTVVGLSLPTLSQPAFVLKPENVFHKVGSAFGMQDIDLPQAPDFSRRFLLRGVQEHAIRAARRYTLFEYQS